MKNGLFVSNLVIGVFILTFSTVTAEVDYGEPPVIAPFPAKLDSHCINKWWKHLPKQGTNKRGRPFKIVDIDVPRDQVVCFGMYTVQKGVMKMTAQLFPLYPKESRTVRLELKRNDQWKEVQTQTVNDIGWSALFRIESWDQSKDVPYRLRHGKNAMFEGLIRKDPVDKDEIVVGSLNCNSNANRKPRTDIVNNIKYFNPDLLYFAGDQSYDHIQHTSAWLLFGLHFREVFKDRPCITIPDDHDVGHGNLWGEGGKKSTTPAGHDGGYFYHHEYVKMVERCQTSHLPDPDDPTPVLQGIGVYYTSLTLGGIDFAIVEDRKFKSGPSGKIPQMGPRPDHVRDPNYDPAKIDLPGLKLLGDRQLLFLKDWGQQWDNVSMKVVLSQTGFCGGAHRHGNYENLLHADLDSNGWPQTGRNKALQAIQDAGAVHLAGDQHITTLIRHGIKEFGDGPFAFVAPAIVNNYYKRWWEPADKKPGANREKNSPLPYTGDYLDGFNNKITMYAYANPEEKVQRGGFGLVRFNKKERTITFESWDREIDATRPDAKPMSGWPRTIKEVGKKGKAPIWDILPLQ
ncbi:MAG: hypothetical protein PF904_01610 [Kiritimatiellae bacterium]|jgi:hypothetical protein|nr:hypothetical protein [Kiritimatiellia bacterium]